MGSRRKERRVISERISFLGFYVVLNGAFIQVQALSITMSDLSPDEIFAMSTSECSRGHPTKEMEEEKQHPDDPWTRYFVCPVCEFSFWEKIDVDGNEVTHYQSEDELPI
jgi:hypothetical protein